MTPVDLWYPVLSGGFFAFAFGSAAGVLFATAGAGAGGSAFPFAFASALAFALASALGAGGSAAATLTKQNASAQWCTENTESNGFGAGNVHSGCSWKNLGDFPHGTRKKSQVSKTFNIN